MSYETKKANPTSEAYGFLNLGFSHFNAVLFDGKLPPCLITYTKKNKTLGYFAPEKYRRKDEKAAVHEIAMNPAAFASRKVEDTLSTLVHEMVHLEQQIFGKPSRNGYHNKEWAKMMHAVGLHPSSTGKPGGKESGPRISHYIVEGGRFAQACADFLKGKPKGALYCDLWADDETRKKAAAKSASKTKYSCPGCGLNAWAKPDARLDCSDCEMPLEVEL